MTCDCCRSSRVQFTKRSDTLQACIIWPMSRLTRGSLASLGSSASAQYPTEYEPLPAAAAEVEDVVTREEVTSRL